MGVFGKSFTPWNPTYLAPTEAKKGAANAAADALKWLGKTLTTKKCAENEFPPVNRFCIHLFVAWYLFFTFRMTMSVIRLVHTSKYLICAVIT